MTILVTGGAGYIGSATVRQLCDMGHKVLVVDNLLKGKRALVDTRAYFYESDTTLLKEFSTCIKNMVTEHGAIDTVIHFAARKDTGESMEHPERYNENITGLLNVLTVMKECSISKIVFSSSAAVYGETEVSIVDETHPCNPSSYYGYTKYAGEEYLKWYKKLSGIEFVALRYFNVAGDAGLSYIDPNAKNIFNVIGDVISGKREYLSIYGDDYDTKDGTGVRDYVHINDLVAGHIRALSVEGSHILNLGTSSGYSVKEIVAMFEEVTGNPLPVRIVERRPGDMSLLIACNTKAKEILGWEAVHTLKDMVESTVAAYKNIS